MLLNTVKATIKKNTLLDYGDTVLCAVSGGADSICLLHVMLALKSELNLSVYVANVNHMLRGEESDRDSDFVKSVCKAANIECFYREYDIEKISKERKMGEEECGRICRYEFFEETARNLCNAKIATAHNLNDNAETILFRLIRGSSAHGLSGIAYKRDRVIRPLLDVSRDEIENYLKINGITWCEDSTNKIPVYARNKLRLNVIPQLKEIVNNAEKRIVTAAKIISDDNEYLSKLTDDALTQCYFNKFIDVEAFLSYDISIRRRITAKILALWNMKEVSADKIEDFICFSKKDTGKMFDINHQTYAEKSYNKIYLRERKRDISNEFTISGEGEYLGKNYKISFEISNKLPEKNNNQNAVFDADKLLFPMEIRYRKEGDKIIPKGMSGHKKLSDIFIDTKTERNIRDSVPLVVKNGEIIFVCGIRQSELYKSDETTNNYLIIRYESNK